MDHKCIMSHACCEITFTLAAKCQQNIALSCKEKHLYVLQNELGIQKYKNSIHLQYPATVKQCGLRNLKSIIIQEICDGF